MVTAAEMAKLYSPEWLLRESVDSRKAARVILPVLLGMYHPTTILDIGCGAGEWCWEARRLGVQEVIGVDGSWVPTIAIWRRWMIAHDLECRLPMLGMPRILNYTMALCFEVAEHLTPERGPSLVEDICKQANMVAWSAAIPGQGGEGHVNERSEEYWIEQFAKHGFTPGPSLRGWLEQQGLPSWYKRITIFGKST